jgi:DtxR family transcriptional regulator, Mn-dependent transcriptional regulator
MTSESVQDYLKTIYEMGCEGGMEWVSTTALSRALNHAPASVTAMLKKLAGLQPPLVQHELYHGVRLTEAGEKEALEVVRHHRLIESFLSATLGLTWDQVHAEAHRLEHAISEELEDRIALYLGDPGRDPHGSPIPKRSGETEALDDMPLTDLPTGRPARVRRVLDDDPALLRYLSELGLVLGARVEVTERVPFQGPLYVRVSEPAAVHALGAGVTDAVFVVTE